MKKASTSLQESRLHDTRAVSFLRYVLALTLCGVASGGVGAFMILFLRVCVWIFFGVWDDSFMHVLSAAPATRRVLAVIVGAGIAGCCWAWLRRRESVLSVAGLLKYSASSASGSQTVSSSEQQDSTQPLSAPSTIAPHIAPRRLLSMMACALVQVMAVGAGNSFGRENAPRQMAAAMSYAIARRLRLHKELTQYAIAASAGAALAAVYNTPIAAIAFTAGVTLRRWNWKICLSAAYISAIATPIAWLVNRRAPSTPIPAYDFAALTQLLHQASSLTLASLALILALTILFSALAGILMRQLCDSASDYARKHFAVVTTAQQRRTMILSMLSAGVLTGSLGLVIPQLLGNGKNTLDVLYGNAPAITGITLATACGVIIAKPLLTAYSLRAGMIGGLLMPSASVGGSIGCALVLLMQWLVPSAQLPVISLIAVMALVGAACVLAVTQRSGIFATIFLVELAHAKLWMLVIVGIAVALSVLLSKVCERLLTTYFLQFAQ